MAILFVDDGGSNTSPFDTWAKATTGGLVAALADAACVAGSTVYMAHNTVFTGGASVTYTNNGTTALPIKVISVTNGDETTYQAGAIEDYDNSTYDIIFNTDMIIRGVIFKIGDDINNASNGSAHKFVDCSMEFASSGGRWTFGEGQKTILEATDITVQNNATDFIFIGYSSTFIWEGGTLTGDPNFIIKGFGYRGAKGIVRGVDLSTMVGGSLADGFGASSDAAGSVVLFYGCKLNATPPNLVSQVAAARAVEAKMVSCYSDGTPYFQEHSYEGDVYHESGIYRAGVDPSSNNFSAKMITVAGATYDYPLRYKLAERWCSANPTIVVELTHDTMGDGTGGLLENDEVWLETEYPTSGNAAYRQWDRTGKAVPLATPADQGSDAGVSWTGTGGFGTPLEQRLPTTISGGAAGVHTVWVCLGTGAVSTVYVCPQLDVT